MPNWYEKNPIITRALRMLGVLAQGESPSAEQLSEGADALNTFLKSTQMGGLKLWKMDWRQKTFSAVSDKVTSGGETYTCIKSHTSASADEPGVGANWQTYWSLEGTGGSAWATSTAYTSMGDFRLGTDVLDIVKMFWRYNSNQDHSIELISQQEYLRMVDKPVFSNVPLKAWIEKIFDTTNGYKVHLWPIPNDTSGVIHYYAETILNNVSNPTDESDYPRRAVNMLIYGLAFELSHEYGIPLQERAFYRDQFILLRREFEDDNNEDIDMNIMGSAF